MNKTVLNLLVSLLEDDVLKGDRGTIYTNGPQTNSRHAAGVNAPLMFAT